jgi:hypothetical protein
MSFPYCILLFVVNITSSKVALPDAELMRCISRHSTGGVRLKYKDYFPLYSKGEENEYCALCEKSNYLLFY